MSTEHKVLGRGKQTIFNVSLGAVEVYCSYLCFQISGHKNSYLEKYSILEIDLEHVTLNSSIYCPD